MPVFEAKISIEDVAFDNGLIAEKVGICRLVEAAEPPLLEQIYSQAEAAAYSLIYVISAYPVFEFQNLLMGNVVEFRGEREHVLSRLDEFPRKFEIREMSLADWPEIERLYQHSAPTRFSLDPRIGEPLARKHKLLCLKTYYEEFGKFFSVALDSGRNIIGFQVCLPKDNEIDLYEAVVLPQHRTGFAAADMLRHNLVRAQNDCPDKSKLVTRIYSDNLVSTNYHEKLGMVKSQGDYFYHLWIKQV